MGIEAKFLKDLSWDIVIFMVSPAPERRSEMPAILPFRELVTHLLKTMPRVKLDGDSSFSPRLQMQQIARDLIASYWTTFENIRRNSGEAPAFGDLDFCQAKFVRSSGFYVEKLAKIASHEDVVLEILDLMLDAAGSAFSFWQGTLANANAMAPGAPASKDFILLEKLEALIASRLARRADNSSQFFLEGLNSSLTSIMLCIAKIPAIFERDIGTQISRSVYSQLIDQVMRTHRELALCSFDFFVVFVSSLGQGESASIERDQGNFKIISVDGKFEWQISGGLLEVLNRVGGIQSAALNNDSRDFNSLIGCPAHFATIVGGDGKQVSVISLMLEWVIDSLERFYLTRFKD